jgi:histidyl-tRNA synthetase
MSRQLLETANTVARLRGMDDVSQEAWLRRDEIQARLVQLMAGYGYRRLETPMLEPTELFLRKSGGELASQLYSFTDAGSNAVSLRPEFTSPTMRHYLEHAHEVATPARWHYCGPVFRFDASGDVQSHAASGQFTQIGGELIGASSLLADVELISLAASVLSGVGLDRWTLQLADLDVLYSLLKPLGLSERAQAFVVQSVPRLREGRGAVSQLLEEGRHLHLVGQADEGDHLSQAVQGLDDNQARVVLLGLLQWTSSDQIGQRAPEEVVDRLLRKIRKSDDENKLRQALEMASDLAQVSDEPGTALDAAKSVLRNAGADQSATDRLSEILELLSGQPDIAEHIVLDFGLVRGLAYYNGIIFEVTHRGWPVALGGGGRYDGLSLALGGDRAVPALGFAYNLDALMALTAASDESAKGSKSNGGILVLSSDASSQNEALKAAQELRDQGQVAVMDVDGLTLEDAKAHAAGMALGQVLVVQEDGQRNSHKVE